MTAERELPKNSTPNLEEFDPSIIPYQLQVIKTIREFDYSKGVLEILLSGAIGSAKSVLMAHIDVTHACLNPKSRLLLGRKSMPDLKSTLIVKIIEHMEGVLIEGQDYEFNRSTGYFRYWNDAEFISRSWADRNFLRFRSLELSAASIEEITENEGEYWAFYMELKNRIGRQKAKEHFLIAATNPAGPDHKAYDWFMNHGWQYRKTGITEGELETRKVFYSVTSDNPFLPDWYIQQVKETYSGRELQRMLHGEWVEVSREQIYYAFDPDVSVIKEYKINPVYPICIAYDFNIGLGKPMSVILFQYIEKTYYVFDEVIIHGGRTLDTVEEIADRDHFNYPCIYLIYGDANGKAKSTKYNRTDYEVIQEFLRNFLNNYGHINFSIEVPGSNPPIRKRHNLVNGVLKNSLGETRVKIVRKCKTFIKGLKLTKLKKGSGYLEDDSNEYQHITTAFGYAVCEIHESEGLSSRFGKGRA